jgi:hypothetical protein
MIVDEGSDAVAASVVAVNVVNIVNAVNIDLRL